MNGGTNLTSIRPDGRGRALREASFEVALAAWSFMFGLVLIADRILPDTHLVGGLGELKTVYGWALGAALTLGGYFVITSFLCWKKPLGQLMKVERSALGLLCGAWVGYGAGILITDPHDVASWTAAVFAVAATAARWCVIRGEAGTIRAGKRDRETNGG